MSARQTQMDFRTNTVPSCLKSCCIITLTTVQRICYTKKKLGFCRERGFGENEKVF